VKRDDGLRVNTDDCQARSVAEEQSGKEPQKHSADFLVLFVEKQHTTLQVNHNTPQMIK